MHSSQKDSSVAVLTQNDRHELTLHSEIKKEKIAFFFVFRSFIRNFAAETEIGKQWIYI